MQLKPDEVVFFSYIVYKDCAHRDAVNEKVMKDPRITGQDPKTMPFDGKRMIYGGFEVVVDVVKRPRWPGRVRGARLPVMSRVALAAVMVALAGVAHAAPHST